MRAIHVVPGTNDPTCGIAVAAKQLIARSVGKDDEVWVHSMWTPMTIKASFKALLRGQKLVRMPHGCTDPTKMKFHWYKKCWVAPIERWLFRRAERIIATCSDEVRWIKAFEPRVKRVDILWLDKPQESPTVENKLIVKRNRESCHTSRLLYVGRLHPLKGVEFLLGAMNQIQLEFGTTRPLQLKIIGRDEGEGRKLWRMAADYKLKVEFCGIVSKEEKESAYQWCDVLVLPTLSENFGLVIAEALERGKRVITTDGAPVWGPEECGNMTLLRISNSNNQPESQIWEGFGGNLVYLKGYRDGAARERIAMLKSAILSLKTCN